MALTQISTAGVKDDAISAGKIPANAIGSSEIADDAVDQGAIADEAVDEARLQISNAGSNGQFLQKQSGNTGGLTWAAANQYTHPNHSGEVTSSADGAQTIATNVVDEDNLKISNAGTNGQFLQKQSGNTGGLTWADAGGGFTGMTRLTSGSSASWSIPSGVSTIKVYCTGGGGGGGRGNNTTAAGSGGAGGTSIHYFDVSGGGSATYTIGSGGSGTNNDNNTGSSGGNSTFAYSGTTITGGGGSGGGSSNNGTSCAGGAGGTASGGTLNLTGGAGGAGQRAGAQYRVAARPAGTAYWGGSTAAKGVESSNTNSQIDNLGCGGVGGADYQGQNGSSGVIVIEY
tara:strand:- start:6 stop:1034 length:1029 start_codon:yes stop_codon:yes gene_type:complete